MEKKKEKSITLKLMIIAVGIAVAAFAAIIIAEKMVLSGYEKAKVVVAKRDIAAKTFIEEKDIEKYFTVTEIPQDDLLDNAITKLSDVKEYITSTEMQKREQLTRNKMLNTTSEILEGFKEPAEVSLMVDNLSYAVSGTLRKGDRVDITAYTGLVDKEMGTVLENVYISGTYDTGGEEVTADSEVISSVVFNFIIERSDYMTFINGTANGGVQLIKVSGASTEKAENNYPHVSEEQ